MKSSLNAQLKNRERNLFFSSALLCSKQTWTSAAENNISKEIWDIYRQYHVHDVFNIDSHRSKINCSHIIRYIFRLLFWYHAFQSIPPSGRQGAASHHLQAHSAKNLVHPPPTSPSYFFHLSPTPADTITPGWEALVPRQRVWSN